MEPTKKKPIDTIVLKRIQFFQHSDERGYFPYDWEETLLEGKFELLEGGEYALNPCYVVTRRWRYGERTDYFFHQWIWKEEDGDRTFFKLAEIDKLLRSGKETSISVLPFCRRCRKVDHSYRCMSNISRGLQRFGIRQRKGVGSKVRFKGKEWTVDNIVNTKERAESLLQASKEYAEKHGFEQTLQCRIRTTFYGSKRSAVWLILKRKKEIIRHGESGS